MGPVFTVNTAPSERTPKPFFNVTPTPLVVVHIRPSELKAIPSRMYEPAGTAPARAFTDKTPPFLPTP